MLVINLAQITKIASNSLLSRQLLHLLTARAITGDYINNLCMFLQYALRRNDEIERSFPWLKRRKVSDDDLLRMNTELLQELLLLRLRTESVWVGDIGNDVNVPDTELPQDFGKMVSDSDNTVYLMEGVYELLLCCF